MEKLKVLDLFSGIGGFSLGLERTGGFDTVAFCEIESFPRKVLAKHWPEVPIYDDVRTLTAERLAADGIGPIDLICGGYPCQPFSTAGRRMGDQDDRHLWPEVHRLLDELRPAWFIGENVAGHISMGLDQVLSDLEASQYAARTFAIPACAADAPHRRNRVWIVANLHSFGVEGRKRQGHQPATGEVGASGLETDGSGENVANAGGRRRGRKNGGQMELARGTETISASEAMDNSEGGFPESYNRRDTSEAFKNESRPITIGGGEYSTNVANVKGERRREVRELRHNQSKERIASGGQAASGECKPTLPIRLGGIWPVEPNVGGGLDGFSFWLDGLDMTESHKLYMAYANATNTGPTEILRTLRSRICPQADEWAVGRSFRVSSEAVLFAYLRQLEKHAANEARIQLEGAQASEKELRGVRNEQEPSSTPHRSECGEQSGVEHSNALQALSRLLALNAEKAWIAYRRTDAATNLGWETGIARVAHGVPARVDRLKALGNAVVPEIPFRIGQAILAAINE